MIMKKNDIEWDNPGASRYDPFILVLHNLARCSR